SVSASTNFEKNDKNNNGDKPVKISKAEYNRQYRLKKKVGAKLKSDSAKIVLRQEVGPFEYPTPVPTAPLTQLSPGAGLTIIQHEAALLAYTKAGLELLKKRYHELPLILGSDFNIQFDTDEGLRCVQFLKKELNLDIVSGNTLGTTRHVINNDITFEEINIIQDDFNIEENQLSF
ncbi:hypothetical protein PV325_010774, partial [Microctonus aethiopoides]